MLPRGGRSALKPQDILFDLNPKVWLILQCFLLNVYLMTSLYWNVADAATKVRILMFDIIVV